MNWSDIAVNIWIILGWHLEDTWMILWWYSDNTWMVFGWYLDDTWLVLKTCVLPRQVLANEFTASLHSLSAWKWLAAKKYWLWLKGRLNTAPSFKNFFYCLLMWTLFCIGTSPPNWDCSWLAIYWARLIARQTQVITHINMAHAKDKYSLH